MLVCGCVWVTKAAAAIIAAICTNKAIMEVKVRNIQAGERKAHANHTY